MTFISDTCQNQQVDSYGNPQSLITGVHPHPNGLSVAGLVLDLPATYTIASLTSLLTGAPTSTTVQLQGSMDGKNWTTLGSSTSTTGDTNFFSGTPFNMLRVNVSAVSGGTTPTLAVNIAAYQQDQPVAGGGTQPVSGTVTANQGTAGASAWLVSDGQVTAVTHLTAATTGTGTVNDNGNAAQSYAFQIAVTGTVTAGALTFFGSLDNTTFFNLGTAQLASSGVTAANPYTLVTGTSPMFQYTGMSCRYFRCDVSTNITGGATVTVKGLAY